MPVAPTAHRPLLGIALMCLAGTVLPLMNALAKQLAGVYPAEQVVWARLVSHLFWVFAFFWPRGGLGLLRTTRPAAQLVRSLAMLVSSTMFFSALPHLGLAEVSVINFVSPFMVMLIALPMLGERIVADRLLAVLVGFAGVIVVIRPGGDLFHWASVVVFASSGFYALYQVLTRLVAGHDRPETTVIYSVLAGAIALTLAMPWYWVPIAAPGDALVMASLGALGAFGHYCIARAMTYAPASVISPFNYWQLIGSVVLGYAMFGDLPDAWTWTGAAIIIAAGLYIGWSEVEAAAGMSASFEELDHRPTPMGALSLRRRRDAALGVDVHEIKLDDEFLMSSLFTAAEIALARLELAAVAGSDLDVVVGGLGLGFTAATALDDSRVRSLVVVEALDAVIDWHRRGLIPLGARLTADSRCRLASGDFFALAASGFDPAESGRRFDAILLDIDHSPRRVLHPSHAAFYAPVGLRRLAAHLKPGGVFALWSDDPPDDAFLDALGCVFESQHAHVVAFRHPVQDREATNTVFVALKARA